MSAKPKYTSKEQIIGLIDDYFASCEGEVLRNGEGNPMFDKFGLPIMIHQRPPTTAGLARALGFATRQSLFQYKAKKEFTDVIQAALLRIEQYTEERLFDRDGVRGATFSLQNNFRFWKGKEEKEDTGAAVVKIICDIPRPEDPKCPSD